MITQNHSKSNGSAKDATLTSIEKLTEDLKMVTAERDGYRSDIERFVWNLAGCDTIASGWGKPGDYNEEMALPALDSVSRMASERDALRARVAELDATIAELTTDGNAATLAANLAKASKRNAELESNCRDLRVAYEQNASQCVQLNRELAMKPDTVEWLNGATIQRQRAEQAEARVAELDESLHLANGTADLALHHRDIAEQRNAELEAALDDLLGCPTVTDRATCPNGDPSRIDEAPEWQAVIQISCAWTRYKKLKALARVESATAAKHGGSAH